MSGSGSGLDKIMDPDPDPVCPERLGPDPVCIERLDPDPVPDPVCPESWILSISDRILNPWPRHTVVVRSLHNCARII